MWFQPPEMELLEVLGGGEDDYRYFERFVFDGNRDHALRSMTLMRSDRLIEIELDGVAVEDWRLAAWRRSPRGAETKSQLQRVKLSLTEHGLHFYWGDQGR